MSNDLCLQCHTEINTRVKAGKGYHSSKAIRGKQCFTCHSEHHGRGFQLVRFDTKGFDHSLTGYQLTGKHAQQKCASCHDTKYIADPKLKKRKGTYLGLKTECGSCHEDRHNGTAGKLCGDCHTTDSFKPAKYFDHSKTNFQLTNRHKTVPCERCHPQQTKDGKTLQPFTSKPFLQCSGCHADPHKGKFGGDCSSCHSTISFSSISNIDKFDHSKTNFPLAGKHISVACSNCHIGSLSSKPKYANCTDCHTDYHQGELDISGDCVKCHTTDGFSPSRFGLQEHESSAFPLTGAHPAVPCSNCHYVEKEERWSFSVPFQSCTSCHTNPHGTSLPAVLHPDQECVMCHTTNRWQGVTYDHTLTQFPLLGKHSSVDCRKCHVTVSDATTVYTFSGTNMDCSGCHNDPHSGQFTKQGEIDCSRCHTENDWSPSKFDHATTRFQLKGRHSGLPCEKCHKKIETGNGSYIQFTYESVKCGVCH